MLSAYPTVVQTGTKPTLTWSILYPSNITTMVTVVPPGTLQINTTSYMTVQIVGTGVTNCEPSQASVSSIPTDVRMSLNGGSYTQLFYGTQAAVVPQNYLYSKKLNSGTKIDFAGRYDMNGVWSPLYTTRSSNFQLVALSTGQSIPSVSPTTAGYLKPYLDTAGKVNVGPMSVLILMELGQADHNSSCFDYQDQVLLVTFSAKHPNNGHGNNLDGVDSSNPGQGSGGPNGAVDPSGGIDDERK
jgi:hypothetical protein